MTETDLKDHFSRVREGSKEAFAQIYGELKKPVFTVAYRIVRSAVLAEDITQDVFVKLFVSPPEPAVKNLRAWIFRMARNLSFDALRKRRTGDVDGVLLTDADCADAIVTRMDVERAIGTLPRIEREILSLHLSGGLHFSKVSDIVGLSVPSTYRRYRKALKALRELL